MPAETKPLWRPYENLDDRREVHLLLTKIPPRLRLQWLRWCCTQCALPNSNRQAVVPPGAKGNAMEVYFDFWMLVNQYQLEPAAALEELVRLARGRK